MALANPDATDKDVSNDKFVDLVKSLLPLTCMKLCDKKLINSYLNNLNELDYKQVTVTNKDAVLLLLNQLCAVVSPTETFLVKNTCQLLINLTPDKIELQGRTFATCLRWLMEALEFSQPFAWNDVLLALENFFVDKNIEDINHYLQLLLGKKRLLIKHLKPCDDKWSEINLQAIRCLEGLLVNKENNAAITQGFLHTIKHIILDILSSLLNSCGNRQCQSKILCLCLHILHIVLAEKLVEITSDLIGEILGVVQAFLFYSIKDYLPIKPQLLRPAAMNLPERAHTVPKCRNLKNPKMKSKKQYFKKPLPEVKSSNYPECKEVSKHSSESDTSDSETKNFVQLDSRVRLEAVHLLQALVKNTQSREIFGYWPQIVATGSRNDARVLTRSIIKEPVSKIRQNVLSTLTDLLISARPFLIHAEDAQPTSFITFFGVVYSMVKELHYTLSLALNLEKNVAVLTHALKCAAALIQGTPYARLKPGLASHLIKHCRLYISHKDPTIKVATLSVFEALVSTDTLTPEILDILAEQSVPTAEFNNLCISTSPIGNVETEEEEIDIEDVKSDAVESCNETMTFKNIGISSLLQTCLENISTKSMSMPVRLQSLKLIGSIAFNSSDLLFPYLELVTNTLISVVKGSDVQAILHACRALEIIAGYFTNMESNDNNVSLFWDIVFEPMIVLAQHQQTVLREAACDCLGTINSNMFTQLTRQKVILVFTTLIGAVHDEESSVRAAGLRALGMLVTLPSLEEDTGFLMDLADIVCLASDDKNLGVRIKAAWTLANLCDCLIKRKNENVEPISLEDVLPKLYDTSVKAAKDNDKVKCNAVRAVGSILHMCPEKDTLKDTSLGLETLINCAILGNDMKVRWNACRALGLVLSYNPDYILPSSWQDQVFPPLCTLICHSPNFKVRTNAAWALSCCNSYGKYISTLWKSIVLAFENSQHVPSYVEYSHRDALVQQLCLTLSHIASFTKESELQSVWTEIGDHTEDISNFMKQFQENILPEKMGDLIKAKAQLEKYMKSAPSLEERQIACTLVNIFNRTNHYDNLDIAATMQPN